MEEDVEESGGNGAIRGAALKAVRGSQGSSGNSGTNLENRDKP